MSLFYESVVDCPVSSPSPMMTEDDPLPQLSSTDMDPQTPPSNEQQVTDASSPVKSQETTGETPQQLVTLVDESLKRIKALEERISALQSTVTSAASTPAKPLPPSLLRDLQRGVRSSPSRTSRITVDCGGSDVTQSPIVTRRSSPVHPASAFMKSLIAEMRTVQLRPVGGSRTNAAMKNL